MWWEGIGRFWPTTISFPPTFIRLIFDGFVEFGFSCQTWSLRSCSIRLVRCWTTDHWKECLKIVRANRDWIPTTREPSMNLWTWWSEDRRTKLNKKKVNMKLSVPIIPPCKSIPYLSRNPVEEIYCGTAITVDGCTCSKCNGKCVVSIACCNMICLQEEAIACSLSYLSILDRVRYLDHSVARIRLPHFAPVFCFNIVMKLSRSSADIPSVEQSPMPQSAPRRQYLSSIACRFLKENQATESHAA